jgi:hypothetical protein
VDQAAARFLLPSGNRNESAAGRVAGGGLESKWLDAFSGQNAEILPHKSPIEIAI